MEENNKKIKLTTIILFILVIAVIIAIVALVASNINNGKNEVEDQNVSQIKDNEITQKEDQNQLQGSGTSQDTGTSQGENPSYANTELDFKFLKMENKKANIVYSPLSIKYALQMLNEGANGNTKTQIENVIGNTKVTKYDNIKDVLSLANALYIRDTYSQNVKDEYKTKLLNQYNAEIKYDAFKNAYNINNWIENKTFGQIKNMLKDEIVTNPDNEMFLINALAIDMEWKEKFDEENTYGNTFYLENGEEMQATMMNEETKSDNISYYKDSDVTAISMDLEQYENNQLEFIAIMPNENLEKYVENFEANTLQNITNKLTSASKTKNGVNIFIPRFSFDYDLNLADHLKTLNITDAFNPNLADFSNMSNKKPLWVGGALHKANIDFSEKGVKAAAVTVIYMTDNAVIMKEEPIIIKIDKPFMYLIKDKQTNEIWFVGTIYEPNSWENDESEYVYR